MLEELLNDEEPLKEKPAAPVADVLTPDVKAEPTEVKDASALEVVAPDSAPEWKATEASSESGFSPEAYLAETDTNSNINRPPVDIEDFLGTKVESPAPSPLMKDETISRLFENAPLTDQEISSNDNMRGSVFEKNKLLNDTKAGMGKFINDVAAKFDPTNTPAEVITNPVGAYGFGLIKALDRFGAAIAQFPDAVADGMNRSIDGLTGSKGTDIYKTPEFLNTVSEAMNWYADTLDQKASESVAESFKDGNTAEAFVKKLTTITGDTAGSIVFYGEMGIKPWSAQSASKTALSTMKVRAAHATAFGLVKGFFGTTGTVEERTQAGAITTAFMATTVASPWVGRLAEKFGMGKVVSALGTKSADFLGNTALSIGTKSYKDAQDRATQLKEEYGLTPKRFKMFGIETDVIELMMYASVAVIDGYFSALTTGFGRPAGTAERGRTVTTTKDAALKLNEQDNAKAQQYVADARADLTEAQTPVEKAIANSRIDQGLSNLQELQTSRAAIEESPSERIMFDNPNDKASRMAARVSQDLVRKDEEMFMTVHHGGPSTWQPERGYPNGRARLDKIGTGEGAAAFGWGFYAAEERQVASSYARSDLTGGIVLEGKLQPVAKYDRSNVLAVRGLAYTVVGGDQDASTMSAIRSEFDKRLTTAADLDFLKEHIGEIFDKSGTVGELKTNLSELSRVEIVDRNPSISLYKLDIPDDVIPKLLDWDKPVSDEIADKIYKATDGGTSPRPMQKGADGEPIFVDGKNLTGQEIYESLTSREGSKQAASEFLSRAGIPGNKYLDQGSRGMLSRGNRFQVAGGDQPRAFPDRETADAHVKKHGGTLADTAGGATSNYVIWDQPTLDRTVLLERNQEKIEAIRGADREMFMEGDSPAGPSRPLNQDLWKVPDLPEGQQVVAGKVSEIVDRIAPDDPSAEILGKVFRDVEEQLGTLDIDVLYANDPKRKYFGVYKVKEGKQSITLNFGTIGKDADLASNALGHERTHAVTTAVLDNPMTPSQKGAKDKIDVLRQRSEMDQQKYTQFADKNFKSHFKNIHEFMAGFKTDMTFRSYLRVVEQDNASVFRRLVDTVKGDVFGIKVATDADLAFDRLIEFPEMQQEIFQTRTREEKRKKGMIAERVNEEAIAKERDHLPAPRHPVGSESAADWADKQAAEKAAYVEQSGDEKGRWAQRQWEDAASRLRDYQGDVTALNTVEIAELLGVKNPAANPGDRARKIYAEIDMMRRYGAAQVVNDASSLDQARGMPAQPEAKTEFTGDRSASEYVQRGWKMQDKTRDNTRHKKFSVLVMTKSRMGGPHEGLKDAHDMFGAIETATGERGVYSTAREILKGRQYYSRLRESVGDFLAGDGYMLKDAKTGMLDTKQVFDTVEDARVASDGTQEIVRKRPASREIMGTLPESLRGEMHAYMSGKPQDAPNLDKYWRDIGDVWKYLNNGDPTNLARVKFRRILHYAKDGKKWSSITKEQQQFLNPVRVWYQKNVQSGASTTGDFYDYVRQIIETSESDVLVRGNYVPHVSKRNSHQSAVNDIEAQRTRAKEEGILTPKMNEEFDRRIESLKYNPEQDPDNPIFGEKHISDIDLGSPEDLKKRSTTSLKTRDPNAEYNPFESNPLTESYDNYFRHMAAYYMEPHVEDMRAKIITGRYSDGTPANSRSSRKHGEGLVDDTTAKVVTKWMQSLVGLHIKRDPWEQVLAKAKGNATKLIFSRFNLIPKQMMQEGTTMEGAPYRYRLKPHEKMQDYLTRDLDRVRSDFRKKVVDVYGEDMADDFMSRMANEILIGKHQMKREIYGDIPAVDWSDMAIGFQFFWRPFSWLTDNKAIDLMNKAPLAGGDFAATKQTEFDSKNRYIHMMGWLNAGKDLVLDPIAKGEQPPPFEKLLGTLRELGQSPVKMETFSEANKMRLAELYARGQYKEFVWAVSQDHTQQGHYIYDTKVRAPLEVYSAVRLVTQYQSWTRNYMMRQATAWKTTLKGDRLSESPNAKRLAGLRTLVEGVGGAAFMNVMFQAATGRLPAPTDGDLDEFMDFPDMLGQSLLQTLNPADWVDPYSSSPLAIPMTPVHMVQGLVQIPYPWQEKKWGDQEGVQMPSQITSSVMNYAKALWVGPVSIALADAYRRFGDEEAGNKMLKGRIESTVNNADEFIEAYVWPYMRAGFVMDSVEFDMEDGVSLRKPNYRNYNLVKGMVTAIVTKKLGYTPEWIEPYDDPSHVERSLLRTAAHFIGGGGTPPYKKVEEVKGFSMPKPEKSDRERDISRERLDRSAGVGSRERRIVP